MCGRNPNRTEAPSPLAHAHLSRVVCLAADGDWLEGTAAHEDGAAVGELVGLLGGALALRSGVRQRLDDGPLVQLGHAAQDRRRERVGRGAHAHQHSRPERLHRLGQRAHVRHPVRVL